MVDGRGQVRVPAQVADEVEGQHRWGENTHTHTQEEAVTQVQGRPGTRMKRTQEESVKITQLVPLMLKRLITAMLKQLTAAEKTKWL